MTGTDYSAIFRELEKAGYFTDGDYGTTVSDAIFKLFATLDSSELEPADRIAVGHLFSTLVTSDFHLGNETDERSEWKQFYLGSVRPGEVVRIKKDAYDSPSGMRHNGLVGVFTSARAGRCMVNYYGRRDGKSHEHAPDNLEVLKK